MYYFDYGSLLTGEQMNNDQAFQENAIWAALILATEELSKQSEQPAPDLRLTLCRHVLSQWKDKLPEGYAEALAEHLEKFKERNFPSRWQCK